MTDTPPQSPGAAPPTADSPDPLWMLAARLPSEAIDLITAEANLATAEVRYNFGRLALAFAIIMAGGIIFGVAGIALLGAVIAALNPYLGPVWSSLLTALVAAIAGGALMAVGIVKMRDGPLAPRKAMHNLRRHAESLNIVTPRDKTDEQR